MLRTRSWPVRIALILAVLGGGSLEASVVTFGYEATVRSVGANLAGGPFSVGQLVTGRFSFDSATPNLGSASLGRYAYESFTWELGSYAGSSAGNSNDVLGVYNDVTLDDVLLVRAQTPNGPAVKGLALANVLWRLIDPSGSVFSDVTLPLTPPPISAFDATNVNLNFLLLEFGPGGTGIDSQVRAEITNLFAVTVPEPATGLLLFLGLGAARRAARRGTEGRRAALSES